MKCLSIVSLLTALFVAGSANAWHLSGRVKCPDGAAFKDIAIHITGTADCYGSFSGTALTDADGFYIIALPDCDGSFTATLDIATLPADVTLLGSASVSFTTTVASDSFVADWELGGAACELACWFTGGGARKDPLIDIPVGHKGKWLSFGGNVNPGCSATAGEGGNWNHIDRLLNVHFQGRSIQVLNCGNVTPPPPPGSTSPRTPFNFIEWTGTGTLKGIQGNKIGTIPVHFFARTEDRNEPGTKDSNAGSGIDRYHLHVYTDPDNAAGTTLLLVNGNTDPSIVDPIEIDDGNFQIHISSCDKPPTP